MQDNLRHGIRHASHTPMTLAALLRMLVATLVLAASAWAVGWWQRGHETLALLGALFIVLPHAPLMALEFALLRRANRDDPVPTPTAGELLRAWAGEVVGAVRVFAWRQPFRSRRYRDHLPPDAAGRRGLLLVHGFVCNRGLWNPWWPRLRQAGVPCIALDLQPVFGSIDDYADAVDDAVRRLTEATGRPPLLVGHSMGGLALRAWARKHAGHARMHGAITVGTPHRGTWLGRFAFSANGVQMRWDSPWLGTLAGAEAKGLFPRFTCFFSHCDNIVFPASTATLAGADNRHLRGQAHVHMLQHPAVLDEVMARLAEPDAAQPGANSRSPGSTAPASISASARTSA
jgi:pimeloyl-ACP methyl ester carboxylesterase